MAGREDSIMVIAVNHEVTSPRDASTGRPTGRRMHVPLVITKEIDRSSPLLMNVLVNNEKIQEFKLRFWQSTSPGHESQFYTIQLVDAGITGIRFEMLNNRYPENAGHKEYEHVSFCYKEIVWIYEEDEITANDVWER